MTHIYFASPEVLNLYLFIQSLSKSQFKTSETETKQNEMVKDKNGCLKDRNNK